MTKIKNIVKNNILLIIVFILVCTTTTYATTGLSSSSVFYDNSTSGSTKTTVKDAIDDLYTKAEYISFKVGDYVKMTPTKTSYVIPKTLTGYSADQSIKPSELNLWRVIRLNADGTVDMVSEYVSSTNVYVTGLTAFTNIVGTLNYIASQYENKNYTVSSRHFGYSTQTEYLTNTSKITSTPPWTAVTSNNDNEALGGGDILYATDTNLIYDLYGTYKANKIGTTTGAAYWWASRGYYYFGATYFAWGGRIATADGVYANVGFYEYQNGSLQILSPNYAVRPIVTLRSDIKATGAGTSGDPYVLK